MVGVAVDPDFAGNRYLYVYFTRKVRGSCGTGGAASDDAIELQGDLRDRVRDLRHQLGVANEVGVVAQAHGGRIAVLARRVRTFAAPRRRRGAAGARPLKDGRGRRPGRRT